MLHLRQELLEMLRAAARQEQQPSSILRTLITELGPDREDRALWVRYFSEAFCFTNGQGYKIFGWFPDGTGALNDGALNTLLASRIEETRAAWDTPGCSAVELAAPTGNRDD